MLSCEFNGVKNVFFFCGVTLRGGWGSKINVMTLSVPKLVWRRPLSLALEILMNIFLSLRLLKDGVFQDVIGKMCTLIYYK